MKHAHVLNVETHLLHLAHLGRAQAALAHAPALERLHLPVLVREHRLRVAARAERHRQLLRRGRHGRAVLPHGGALVAEHVHRGLVQRAKWVGAGGLVQEVGRDGCERQYVSVCRLIGG